MKRKVNLRKKQVLAIAVAVIAVIGAIAAWQTWGATTKIAFLNFQVTELGQISKANDNSMIELCEISADDIADLDSYDMVMVQASAFYWRQARRLNPRCRRGEHGSRQNGRLHG